MSMRHVHAFTEPLPRTLREQVRNYAYAVEDAVPDIAREARVTPSARLRDDIVVIAAVRKLQAILEFDRWASDRILSFLSTHDVSVVPVGSQRLARGMGDYADTVRMMLELNTFLNESGLDELVQMNTYAEIAAVLSVRYQ